MQVLYRSIIVFILVALTLFSQAQGLKLFNSEIRNAADYPYLVVMDFIERYFGIDLPNQRQTTREKKMVEDKVYFRKGKPEDLYLVTDSMPFSINFLERYYEVQWMKDDKAFITLVFPAQYDLIMGQQQNEYQNKLKERILKAPESHLTAKKPVNLTLLEDSTYMMKTESLELESLNDALYYNKVREDYVPVFDEAHLDYSAANLFHGLIEDADFRMYIEQSIYGMKTINYSITLKQWLNYCSRRALRTARGTAGQGSGYSDYVLPLERLAPGRRFPPADRFPGGCLRMVRRFLRPAGG